MRKGREGSGEGGKSGVLRGENKGLRGGSPHPGFSRRGAIRSSGGWFWQFSGDRVLLAWLRGFRLRRPLPAAAWRQGRFELVAAPLAGRGEIKI